MQEKEKIRHKQTKTQTKTHTNTHTNKHDGNNSQPSLHYSQDLPSVVVYTPPNDPGSISKPNSFMLTLAVFDFKTSRCMSSGFVPLTVNVHRRPFNGTPPPALISLVRYPHSSQLNAKMTMSLKCTHYIKYLIY